MELQPKLSFDFLKHILFLKDCGLGVFEIFCQVLNRGLPLLCLSLYLAIVNFSQFDKLTLKSQVAGLKLLQCIHV